MSAKSVVAEGGRPTVDGRRFSAGLLDQITTGILTADDASRISLANRMALETLQLSPDSCLGRTVLEVFGHRREVATALQDVAAGGERRIDFALEGPAGRRLDLGMTLMRATPDAPPDVAYVLLFRDLGDRRQFELELRRVERLTAIGHMVAGFAHEVRNPLAAIQALVEALVAETPAGDPRREYGTRILGLLVRVERFVKASLQFAEPKPPERRRHEPAALVGTAFEALGARWGRRGTPPAMILALGVGLVEVDESQIVECLLALIENAVDATQDPSRVQIRVSSAEDPAAGHDSRRAVRLEVRDDGPGIPPGLLSRIFDPFFTTKAKGTGLGLSLAQTLVRENGGRLLARSEVGVETVFTVVLPEVPR